MDISKLKFDEMGLIPAIVQDINTRVVLMQAYMNKESLELTLKTNKVCFYSRSRKKLWTKGEESGNFLNLKAISSDCDNDTLLVKVIPDGPACHLGTDTCWGENNEPDDFLFYLENFLQKRKNDPVSESYTSRLINSGINRVAQKVGEEAVEVVIESKDDNEELFLNEAADLMYHYIVLLIAKGYSLKDVCNILRSRHKK